MKLKSLDRNQIMDWLKDLGWEFHKDEVGDKFCIYRLGNGLLIQASVGFRKHGELLEFYMSPSVTTEYFGRVSTEIFGSSDKNGFEPIVVNFNEAEELIQKSYTQQDVKGMSDRVIEWGSKQDINVTLNKYADLPTDCVGSMPLRHLAALVLLRKVDKLQFYLTSFQAGDRLDFVNYVTDDMIIRAVDLAKK